MASVIDTSLAKILIAAFREFNSSPDGPALLTPSGQFLNGFFIDRESLDSILVNPDVVGISIHLAKHPDFPDSDQNIFTIIFSGAEPNPNFEEGNGTAPFINRLKAFDQVQPCPPVCTDIL